MEAVFGAKSITTSSCPGSHRRFAYGIDTCKVSRVGRKGVSVLACEPVSGAATASKQKAVPQAARLHRQCPGEL